MSQFNIITGAALAILGTAGLSFAATIHVPADQPTIQAGINAANTGDEVVVAPGTYSKFDFNAKAITVRSSGGRDVTIINGNVNDSVVKCVSGEGGDTILNGFTITGGGGNDSLGIGRVGGGMFIFNSSPTVINCIFKENTLARFGGGMFTRNGNPPISNCIFQDNEAEDEGAGMYNDGMTSASITDCQFVGNSGGDGSGAGVRNTNCSMTFLRCDFTGNSQPDLLGGGMGNSQSTISLIQCLFENNTAGIGGGISNSGGDLQLTDCTFDGNWTTNSTGGAISHDSGTLSLLDCTIENNQSQGQGAASYIYSGTASLRTCTIQGNNGDGIVFNEAGTLTIEQCVFDQNVGSEFGAIETQEGDLVANCTFTANQGCISGVSGEGSIVGCLFENNSLGGAVGNCTGIPSGSPQVILACDFISNDGYFGGGVELRGGAFSTFIDCRFIDNSAPNGGAVGVDFGGKLKLINCLFQGNSANGNGLWGYGGGLAVGIWCDLGVEDCPPPIRATATVINSTFAGNLSAQGGGGIAVLDDGHVELINTIVASNTDDGAMVPDAGSDIAVTIRLPTMTNSCVPGLLASQWENGSPPSKSGTVALTGSGNTGDDPLFAAGPQGDFYLSQTTSGQGTGSPCVDTGFGPANVLYAAGTTRTDGGNDSGTVDMGYHYDAAMIHRADGDGDGDVDGVNFGVFASCFNGAGKPPRTAGCSILDAARFDFDNDRDIDGADFGIFASCFNKAGNPPRTDGCPPF